MAHCQFESIHGDGCPFRCTRCGFVSQSGDIQVECPAQAHLPRPPQASSLVLCRHCGGEVRRETCPDCPGSVRVKIFRCAVHRECTHQKRLAGVACCAGCSEFVTQAGRPAAGVVTSPCACAGPGWCPAFGRFQTQHDWHICRGLAMKPKQCDEQRGLWLAESQHENRLACVHRGDSRRERWGTAIYDCAIHGQCTLEQGREDQVEAVCRFCRERLHLRPPLLARRRIDPSQLLPAEHQFNCSVIRHNGKLLMAYRLHWSNARIVLAELDEQLNVAKNYLLKVRLGEAQEDPRLFVFRDELHVSYSALYRQGDKAWTDVCYARLDQDANGDWRVADEFTPHYPARTTWEKNWGFFEHDGELLAVYSISPHRVLRIEGNRAELIAEVQMRFPAKPGMLHGGAPPVFHRGEYYCFYHRRLGASSEKFYTLDLYTFEAKPPFRPSRQIVAPLLVPDPSDRPGPDVPQAVFPGGAFIDQRHRWTVSYGYYDKWSEIAWWDINRIESCLVPLPASMLASVMARKGTNDLAMWKEVHDWNEYVLPDAFEPDDVIIDVGAHVGSFTRACLDRGAGIVIACEPYPPSYELLKQNCAYYVHKADCWQVAVGGQRGMLTLRNRDASGISHVAVSGHFKGGPVVCEASVVPLNEIMPPCRIRLLKLDCEGAEYEIVAAADLTSVEEIVGEAHRAEWRGKEATIDNLAELLAAKGFVVESRPLTDSAWLFMAIRGNDQ
jgi:FkbM family methyltransferase